MTEKSFLAKRRNWLLYRLKGIKSVFGEDNIKLIYKLTGLSGIADVENLIKNLDQLILKITEGNKDGLHSPK